MNPGQDFDEHTRAIRLLIEFVPSPINPFDDLLSDRHQPRDFTASRLSSAGVEMIMILSDDARLIALPFDLTVKVCERPPLTTHFPTPEVAHLLEADCT